MGAWLAPFEFASYPILILSSLRLLTTTRLPFAAARYICRYLIRFIVTSTSASCSKTHGFRHHRTGPGRTRHTANTFLVFGDDCHNRPKNSQLRFNLYRLREQAERGRLDRTNDLLERIYRSQEFISPAAAIRPEEDFVETYKFKVLSDAAGGQPVEFRFGRQKISVSDRLKSDVIDRKVECLRALGLLSGQP